MLKRILRFLALLKSILLAGSIVFFHVCYAQTYEPLSTLTLDHVRFFQTTLKENGSYTGPVDGTVNPPLVAAVKKLLEGLSTEGPETDWAMSLMFEKKLEETNAINTAKDNIAHYIVNLLDNRNEYNRARKGKSKRLVLKGKVPSGNLKYSAREPGNFTHILHTYRWEFFGDGKCAFTREFLNITKPEQAAKGTILGRCELVQWKQSQDINLFFWPEVRSGVVWTADKHFDFQLSLRSKGLFDAFQYQNYGNKRVIAGNAFE